MSEDRERDWAELEARALRLLDHAKEVEPRAHVRTYGSLLRLWHFPAFGPQRSWTILTPGRKSAPDALPLVREVSWDRAADQRTMFEVPSGAEPRTVTGPRIDHREATLLVAELERLMGIGVSLTVPIVLSGNTVGLDGDYFGLETYAVSPNVRTQWWGSGPTEWRHFTDWVTELRDLLERSLDNAG